MKKKSIILYIGCLLATPLFAQQNNLTADSRDQNKALRDSLVAATSVLAYHPDSIDLRLKKAAWNIQLEQWSYAKDDLDKVLFLNNTNIAGLFYRAFVNEKLLRYNFARLDYQNLLVLVPGNFQAQLGLALLNEKDKHYTEAYDGINNLIEQYPDSATANADYRINRIDLLIMLNRKLDAYRELEALQKKGVAPGRLQEFYRRLRRKK